MGLLSIALVMACGGDHKRPPLEEVPIGTTPSPSFRRCHERPDADGRDADDGVRDPIGAARETEEEMHARMSAAVPAGYEGEHPSPGG